MINVKFLALLKDIMGSPSRVDLLTKNGDQVATTSDLACGDY